MLLVLLVQHASAFHLAPARGGPALQTWAAARFCRRRAHGLLQLRAASEPGDKQAPEVDDIMKGIAQLQAGMASIQAGLGKKATSQAETVTETVKTGFAASLSSMQEIIGAEAYSEKIEQAQAAVLRLCRTTSCPHVTSGMVSRVAEYGCLLCASQSNRA